MLTLATLLVRNEFCQEVEDAGGLTYILDVIINHPDTERLNCQALKLLKALAGNDNVKAHIITSGSAPLIISTLSRFKVIFISLSKLMINDHLFCYFRHVKMLLLLV